LEEGGVVGAKTVLEEAVRSVRSGVAAARKEGRLVMTGRGREQKWAAQVSQRRGSIFHPREAGGGVGVWAVGSERRSPVWSNPTV